MLTIEIRINGSIISAMTAVNRGGLEECIYEYQGVTFPVDSHGRCRTFNGTLTHSRSKGAEVLAQKLLKAAAEGPP